MTVIEMHNAVRLGLDKTTALSLPDFELEELNFWLNVAQDRFIKQRLFGTNPKSEGFEDSSKRITDLKNIIIFDEVLTSTSFSTPAVYPNSIEVDLTDLVNIFLYYISSRSEVTRTNPSITDGYVDNLLINQKLLPKYIETGFNDPWFKEPVCFISEDSLFIVHDGLTTAFGNATHDVTVTYVRAPDILIDSSPGTGETITCELDASVHQEIVDLCVYILLENIESQRISTNIEQLKMNE